MKPGRGTRSPRLAFATAATNVEYSIVVTETGRVWEAANTLGDLPPPVTDTLAFECL